MASQVPAPGAPPVNNYGGQPVTSPAPPPPTASGTSGGTSMSNQNLNQIVSILKMGHVLYLQLYSCCDTATSCTHVSAPIFALQSSYAAENYIYYCLSMAPTSSEAGRSSKQKSKMPPSFSPRFFFHIFTLFCLQHKLLPMNLELSRMSCS